MDCKKSRKYALKCREKSKLKTEVNDLGYRSLNSIKKSYNIRCRIAIRTGLEPATSAVTGRHSNQLNYRINFLKSN